MGSAPISAVAREDQVTIGQQEESYFGYSVPLAQSTKKQQKKESSSITEMIRDAKEKADLHREKLERAKPTPRYGDAPMEAYARLSRARTVGEVSSAAGYARRRIAQLQAARRSDPDHADQISAAIGQLQKAVGRAGKKKLELNREQLARARQKRAAQEKRTQEAYRLRRELQHKQTMRKLRESSYFRETDIANRFANQLTATKMELKAQAEQLGISAQAAMDAAMQGYSEGTQLATVDVDAPMSAPQVDVQA